MRRQRGRDFLTETFIEFQEPAIASQSRAFYLQTIPPAGRQEKDEPMNKTNRQVKTEFEPAVPFELETAPFRAVETTELERLKSRLLRQLLQKNNEAERNATLRRAANAAAALASLTPYPLLLFPTLLEEKARKSSRPRQKRVKEASPDKLQDAA
ncbi:MAG: hypothetical protein JWR26_4179 [Pedosphaera sp.]|nr:hypothetical protein [Pedosphaera sp.]